MRQGLLCFVPLQVIRGHGQAQGVSCQGHVCHVQGIGEDVHAAGRDIGFVQDLSPHGHDAVGVPDRTKHVLGNHATAVRSRHAFLAVRKLHLKPTRPQVLHMFMA